MQANPREKGGVRLITLMIGSRGGVGVVGVETSGMVLVKILKHTNLKKNLHDNYSLILKSLAFHSF